VPQNVANVSQARSIRVARSTAPGPEDDSACNTDRPGLTPGGASNALVAAAASFSSKGTPPGPTPGERSSRSCRMQVSVSDTDGAGFDSRSRDSNHAMATSV
jgi:pectin methylesterase-like acyl-CoA thioesterase